MKFSSVFTLLLASLAAATPIGQPPSENTLVEYGNLSPENSDIQLDIRTKRPADTSDDKTTKTSKVKKDKASEWFKKLPNSDSLENGNYYLWKLTWPLSEKNPDPKTEVEKAEQQLQADHIALASAKVVIKPIKDSKFSDKSLDGGFIWELDGTEKTSLSKRSWDGNYGKRATVTLVKKLGTASPDAKLQAESDKYFAAADHKDYNAAKNNCGIYADEVAKAV